LYTLAGEQFHQILASCSLFNVYVPHHFFAVAQRFKKNSKYPNFKLSLKIQPGQNTIQSMVMYKRKHVLLFPHHSPSEGSPSNEANDPTRLQV